MIGKRERNNFMKKKLLSAVLSVAMIASLLMGCGSKEDEKGEVYFLNFKPEVDQVWQDIAKAYTEETGVAVKVVTAASGTYEETLKSEVAKSLKR